MADSTNNQRLSRYAFWAALIIIVLALYVRVIAYPIITDDYRYFLQPWFSTLAQASGLSAFKTPFSNYAPLYLYLIKALTGLPVSSLVSIKSLSVFFDLLLAALAATIAQKKSLVFAAVLAIPTVIINSALWGQSDSLYAAFILLSLWWVIRDRPLAATLAFAVSFCFKVQSLFFLPVLVGYLFRERGRWLYLFLVPLVYLLSVIPAWLGGGSLGELLLVYANQAKEYQALVLSAPTIFTFFDRLGLSDNARELLSLGGVIVAAIVALALIIVMRRSRESLTASRVVLISLFTVLVIPFLLPRMHERYFYLADVLSILYIYYHPRQWYVPSVILFASFLSYLPYLATAIPALKYVVVDFRWLAALLILVILSLLPQLVAHFFPQAAVAPEPKV